MRRCQESRALSLGNRLISTAPVSGSHRAPASHVWPPTVTNRTIGAWPAGAACASAARPTNSAAFPAASAVVDGDKHHLNKPYHYTYTIAQLINKVNFLSDTHLVKHDLDAGTREIHEFGAGRHPGEFVFVPRSADAAEDDGWLMGLVVDAAAQTTDLVILDARRFGAEPQAVVRLPHRVPPGFHGNWVPARAAGS